MAVKSVSILFQGKNGTVIPVVKFQPVLYTRTHLAIAVHITHFGALEHDNVHHRIETRIPAGSNVPERAISIVLIHGSGGKFG